MHNYHSCNGSLPPHALHDKDGRALLSWRVLILPYIEQDALYKKFKLDEPWDSPHNIALLPEMPKLYAPYDGSEPAESHTTFYQVFLGKGATFQGRKGLKLPDDFPDGTSDTFLIIEAGAAVPWTRPVDLPYAADGPLPTLGGLFKDTIRAAFVDSSIRSFRRGMSEEAIRAAITRNGADDPGPDW